MESALKMTNKRQKEISDIADKIRELEVDIAKENSSITQLEKFNSTLESEINSLESYDVNKADHDKLNDLKTLVTNLEDNK